MCDFERERIGEIRAGRAAIDFPTRERERRSRGTLERATVEDSIANEDEEEDENENDDENDE